MRDWASQSGWDKSPPGAGDSGRRRRRTPRPLRRGLRADHRRAVPGLARSSGQPDARARPRSGPRQGILDPQGEAVEQALPALGFDGRRRTSTSAGSSSSRSRTRPQLEEMCRAAARQPADRGLRDRAPRRRRHAAREVRRPPASPGSCDEVDAQLAAVGASARRSLLWHGDRDLQDVDAIVVPGGFSYGDYLRAGAIARFSPVMESVIEFAGDGGLVLGICNGFQVLCEAGLLPGALLPEREPSLHLPPGRCSRSSSADTSFTSACDAGRAAQHPGQARVRAATTPDEPRSTQLEANGQVVLRYAPGAELQRLAARHRRRDERGAATSSA